MGGLVGNAHGNASSIAVRISETADAFSVICADRLGELPDRSARPG